MDKLIDMNVSLSRGDFHFHVDCQIAGGITGVFGPSGHGKSTFLHLIAGLVAPQSGKISIAGEVVVDVSKKICLPPSKRKVGIIFQDGRLFPHLSVLKNLRYGQKLLPARERILNFDDVVDILEIRDLLKKHPAQCSGGERQRIAIGRSLLCSPRLLLMDEPFSAVDVELRNQILPFIQRISHEFKIPMLVVSHDLPDLLKLTERLMLLRNGHCEGYGKYLDLLLDGKLAWETNSTGLLNVFNFIVHKNDPGFTLLKGKNGFGNVKLVHEPALSYVGVGQEVRVSLRAQDVALSLGHIDGSSVQNQLPGILRQVIQKGAQTLCFVDAGIPILSEITTASAKRLKLKPGTSVFCLFKSLSLSVEG